MLTTVTLTAEGPDQTRVTVTWEPHGATTPEELEAFIDARAGMTQGWTGSFDKLEELSDRRPQLTACAGVAQSRSRHVDVLPCVSGRKPRAIRSRRRRPTWVYGAAMCHAPGEGAPAATVRR